MARRSNGEGTVYKRSDGRWCAAYYIKGANGVVKRKYVYAKTQKAVKEKLRELEAYQEPEAEAHLTLEKWMHLWLEQYKRETLKRTTYENYLMNIHTHITGTQIGKTELCNINTDILQRFYNSKLRGENGMKKLSRRTVEYIHTIVGSALKQAYKNELIKKNYNDFTVLPRKEKKEIEPLSLEEVQQVLNASENTEMYALLVLEVFTGLRKGEILGLQWHCIDFEDKTLCVKQNLCRVQGVETSDKRKTELILMKPKTASSYRTLPLSEDVIQVLKQHKKEQNIHKMQYRDVYYDNDIVFAKPDGNFEDPRELLHKFHAILEKAGVRKVRFHDLRHTFASLLLNEGESMKVIQGLLGHSTITTSMDVYSHVAVKTKEKSIERLEKIVKLNRSKAV